MSSSGYLLIVRVSGVWQKCSLSNTVLERYLSLRLECGDFLYLKEHTSGWSDTLVHCALYRITMGYLEEQYLPDTNTVLLIVDFHDNPSHYHDMSNHSYT